MASIIIRTDGRSAREYLLEKELTLIGQRENADINIEEDPDGIDERAFIVRVDDEFVLDNLGPIGSTLVNGQPVKKKILKDRDLIVIGYFRMTFQDNDGNDVLAGFVSETVDSGRTHRLAYLLLGVSLVLIGILGFLAYLDSQDADKQAAKASEAQRSERAEKIYQNARAIGSALKR